MLRKRWNRICDNQHGDIHGQSGSGILMARLSLSFQTIHCSGKAMRIMVERRTIAKRAVETPVAAETAPLAPAQHQPSIAAEVRDALCRGPLCFPRSWWFDA
jgi:hypothetical protein